MLVTDTMRSMSEKDAKDDRVTDWFVYVLINDADVTYTGIAKDVEARLEKHNANIGAKFTRGRGPWRAVHIEGPMAHGDALRREIPRQHPWRWILPLRRAPDAEPSHHGKTSPPWPTSRRNRWPETDRNGWPDSNRNPQVSHGTPK